MKKILKFGGSSVGNAERIKTVVSIVAKTVKDNQIFVIISAFQGVTDILISLAKIAGNGENYNEKLASLKQRHQAVVSELFKEGKHKKEIFATIEKKFQELSNLLQGIYLLKENSARSLDAVICFGEILSCLIIYSYGESVGMPLYFVDTRELIITDATFGNAKVDFVKTNELIKNYFLSKKSIPIITGFIASASDGSTTTLGRSGSDYSASIFGAALSVEMIEIWTDVDGVLTTDPRIVKEAFVLPKISYEEAMEMSHFGAKVIHPQTVQPAVVLGIPFLIKNTLNPDAPGTLISHETTNHTVVVKGIATIDKCALISIKGSFMTGVVGSSMRIFKAIASKGVSVILISQGSSEYTLCLAVRNEDISLAILGLQEEFQNELQNKSIIFLTKEHQAIVAIVGDEMEGRPGVAGKLFSTLGRHKINISAIAQGASERNISFVINSVDKERAIKVIHEAFYAKNKKINIFMIGVGQIGASLLKKINEQKNYLAKNNSLEFRVVALANSKKMFWAEEGINISKWKAEMIKSDENMDVKVFVSKMLELNLPNSVFVDCTANEDVAMSYADILSKGIGVVTPNKKANSGKFAYYKKLKQISKEQNVDFLYETNVGAGLPVINTLNDLLVTGDKIIKIEAVLSGTLSFIFNNFGDTKSSKKSLEKSFSALVKEAKDLGYTEPDPRDDLSGIDVARKILILGREMGLSLELKDVKVESLISAKCRNAKSVPEFFIELKKMDKDFEKLRKKASAKNQVLRYVAILENGKAKVSLQNVGKDSPLYNMSDTENVISFTTKRYDKTPLVIKGPGAGVEVTSAGVLADIIKFANNKI